MNVIFFPFTLSKKCNSSLCGFNISCPMSGEKNNLTAMVYSRIFQILVPDH